MGPVRAHILEVSWQDPFQVCTSEAGESIIVDFPELTGDSDLKSEPPYFIAGPQYPDARTAPLYWLFV